MLQRRLDHAERVQAIGLFRLHRFSHVSADLVDYWHNSPYQKWLVYDMQTIGTKPLHDVWSVRADLRFDFAANEVPA